MSPLGTPWLEDPDWPESPESALSRIYMACRESNMGIRHVADRIYEKVKLCAPELVALQ